MTLAARRSAALRERFVMRLGCVLVSLAVLASLVLEPPRAKAFAVTSSAITALAGGFLAACGLAPVVSGMGNTDEVNESMARLIWDYLTAKRPGVDILHWLGDIKLQLTAGNKLLIPALAVGELTIFAKWVAEKYGTKPGENVVFSDQSITFLDGSTYVLAAVPGVISAGDYVKSTDYSPGTLISYPGEIVVSDGVKIIISGIATNLNTNFFYEGKDHKGSHSASRLLGEFFFFLSPLGNLFIGAMSRFNGITYFECNLEAEVSNYSKAFLPASIVNSLLSDSSLSLDVSDADTMQEVLERLTVLEEGQSVALDVGATSSMEIQEILQGILDAILAGDLAASAEIVDTAEVPVDPPPEEETPDIEGLGLPALGAALITRFPFSIPWDIYKGVSLLAAPPKAPYFEVDFLEPIAYRVGGWRGNTTIVLDFSEYEVIGQICRWTSTIGFCLFLASATKRLIWTA